MKVWSEHWNKNCYCDIMLKWNKIFCLRTREIERQTFITPVASSCCYYSSLLLAFCCCPRFCQAGNTTVWKTYADICPALEKVKKSICALSPLIHADTCWHSMSLKHAPVLLVLENSDFNFFSREGPMPLQSFPYLTIDRGFFSRMQTHAEPSTY